MSLRGRRPHPFPSAAADLLPLVFARPAEALAGARAVLAGRPPPADASVAYQVIGLVQRDFGNASVALRHLRRAARLARRSGSADREADVLGSLGVAIVQSGRTAAGLAMLADAASRASGLTAARMRFRRAAVLDVLGRHSEASEEIRRALPTLRRAGDTIWVARTLTLRALIALGRGAVERADRDLTEAERLFATTDQEHDAAVAVHNRGIAALRGGDLPAALTHFDDASRRYERLGTSSPELSLDRCAALLAAGLATDALTETDAALRRLDRLRGRATKRADLLLAAAQAALAAGDPHAAEVRAALATRALTAQHRDRLAVHSRLLELEARQAAGPATVRLMQQAAAIAVRLGPPEATRAYLLAGRTALALRQPDMAQRYLATAARARYRGPALARANGWLADALRAAAAGDTTRTLRACRSGLAVLHRHRLTLGASELRAQATVHGMELVGAALRACVTGRAGARRLLSWAEHWRATALAVPPVRPPEDRALHAELTRYRDVSSRLERAVADGTPTAALYNSMSRAEREVRAAALHTPGQDAVPNRPLDVSALLDELGGGQLVELVAVDGRLHVLLCGRGRVRAFPAGATAEVVAETEHARSGLVRLTHGVATRPDETAELLAATGQRLERLLLGDTARLLGDGPLVIVPPGQLHAVPWALLPALFARTHEIAPSARTWLRARRHAPPSAERVVLVRGPDLPTETDELTAVAELYQRPTVLCGADATTPRVLDALDGSGLAHLAAHGMFRADSPLFSALRMVDGPLTGYDLQRLRRAPYRLVLPCCDSARLAAAGSDELLGLAAALLPLGTAGLVASVVPVNHAAAVEPMVDLHRGLRKGKRMAEALRDARNRMGGEPVAQATAWSLVAIGAG